MRKIFIILIMGIFPWLSTLGTTTPVSLINEDYVWVYLGIPEPDRHVDMYYRYNGTDEVNGKTFHRFVNFKNHEKKLEMDGSEKEIIYEGFETIVWLAREENRKLIVIYPSDIESEKYTEYVVNDFNLKTGDLVSDCPFYFYDNGPWDERIKAIDHINIQGSECMIQWCNDIPGEVFIGELLRPIVSGVGNCGVGTHDRLEKETTGMTGNWFSRLEDKDGNVLLDRETISKLNPTVDIALVPDMDFSGIEFTNGKVSCRTSDGAEIFLAVYHPDGRLVSEILGNGEASISTSGFEEGVYIIRAFIDNRSISRKIIIR